MNTSFLFQPEDYAKWLNARVGEELRRRRGTRSAYELAIPQRLSDQTILNIEQCVHSATITSLGLVCARLRIRASELVRGLILLLADTCTEIGPRFHKRGQRRTSSDHPATKLVYHAVPVLTFLHEPDTDRGVSRHAAGCAEYVARRV